MLSLLRHLHRLFAWAAIPSFIAASIIGGRARELPESARLSQNLAREPEQEEIDVRPFAHEWRGARYIVTPRATYSLRGVVVSHNDISAIDDIYHTSASVDVRDLCVVWGGSALSGAYRKLEYWSEPWTCFFRSSGPIPREFDPDELSNNHLIPADETIAERIMSARIGDEVEFAGELIDYHPAGASEAVRRTSLERTDTGNGACEVVFVRSFRVVTRSNRWLWALHRWLRNFGWLSVIGAVLLFLVRPWLEFRAASR